MKVKYTAASNIFNEIINIVSDEGGIQEALEKFRDKEFVSMLIDENSWLLEKDTYSPPTSFVINLERTDEYDVEIMIYDYYL